MTGVDVSDGISNRRRQRGNARRKLSMPAGVTSVPVKLNEVMVKENLNWRSMANQGAITEKWNSPATPVYYVIDPDGVIRYKWVGDPGEKAIDAVLEQLIQAAEKDATKAPQ